MTSQRIAAGSALLLAFLGAADCRPAAQPSYLYLWAGDSSGQSSDFLAVIDATPGSAHYGEVLASVRTGDNGTHPHHTEASMPANGHLLANGYHAGKTYLFDVSQPLHPALLTSFNDKAGFSHPHTYVRLADGNVLTTFQYQADSMPADEHGHMHGSDSRMVGQSDKNPTHATGGLVEMDERGTIIRSASARDTTISDRRIYPYSVLPIPGMDRAISTTTDMDRTDTIATAKWLQLWRLSDLKLLKTFALEAAPGGHQNLLTGEPHLLPDGHSVLIHTFGCGLYVLRNVDGDAPTASLVHTFEGMFCGVPILTGHWWLATVPDAHGLVALDVSDPEHPRQVSSLSLGDGEQPHWMAIDSAGRRVVVNSAGRGTGNRLFLVNFDPATGSLAMDSSFKDPGDPRPGISLTGRSWPHGFNGKAVPHGTVFSR